MLIAKTDLQITLKIIKIIVKKESANKDTTHKKIVSKGTFYANFDCVTIYHIIATIILTPSLMMNMLLVYEIDRLPFPFVNYIEKTNFTCFPIIVSIMYLYFYQFL